MRWSEPEIEDAAGGASGEAWYGFALKFGTTETERVFIRDCMDEERASRKLAKEHKFRDMARFLGLAVNFAYVEQHGQYLVFECIPGDRFRRVDQQLDAWRVQIENLHDLDCVFGNGDRHGRNVIVAGDTLYAIDNVEYWNYNRNHNNKSVLPTRKHQMFLPEYGHRCGEAAILAGLA